MSSFNYNLTIYPPNNKRFENIILTILLMVKEAITKIFNKCSKAKILLIVIDI